MDVITPAAVVDPTPVTPQASPAPPTAPVAASAPQFSQQKWEHMQSIATPEQREKMLADLGGVPMSQYLTDHKRILCNTLGIPLDKQYLVAGNSVDELAKSANDVAGMLKPVGNPPAADPLAPSAPAPNAPLRVAPVIAEPTKIETREDVVSAYQARRQQQAD